jgi:hypothetical protein
MMEIEGFVADRDAGAADHRVSTVFADEYDLFDFADKKPSFSRHDLKRRLLNMLWRDQVALVTLAVSEKARLEALRLADERFFTEVKYVAPPVPRPRMPTKGNAAFGGGITGVPRFSEFLSNEELQQTDSTSIANRGRKSIQQTKKAPIITETFRYPRSADAAIECSIRSVKLGNRCMLMETASSVGSCDEDSLEEIRDQSATDLAMLHAVVTRSPVCVPGTTVKLMSHVIHRESQNRELARRVANLHSNSMCPIIQGNALYSAEEKYSADIDDSNGYKDILGVTDHVYTLPGTTEPVSLLNYLKHWKEASYQLSKRIQYLESMLVSMLDCWEDLYDARNENPYELAAEEGKEIEGGGLVVGKRCDEYFDWVPDEPSEEELLMGPNVEMAVEEMFSTQDACCEALQQTIACLMSIENIFFDAFKKMFADRNTTYNPGDALSAAHNLGTLYPSFQLACHFVGYDCLYDIVAEELRVNALPVADRVVKKKREFKPQKGQRFNVYGKGKSEDAAVVPGMSVSTSLPALGDGSVASAPEKVGKEGVSAVGDAAVVLPPLPIPKSVRDNVSEKSVSVLSERSTEQSARSQGMVRGQQQEDQSGVLSLKSQASSVLSPKHKQNSGKHSSRSEKHSSRNDKQSSSRSNMADSLEEKIIPTTTS